MKYLKYFLIGVVFVLTSSYTTGTSRLSEGIYPGNLMPELKISNDLGSKLNLKYLSGVKILVNFWAAYDADSHLKNVLLYNTVQKEKYPVIMISVSFDKSKAVFENTLKIDGIDPIHQYVDINGTKSEIYQKYQLEKGFKNYLIDENGVIVAMNLTPDELKEKLIN